MANEKEAGRIPKRKLPEFKIRESQIKDMKVSAKILEMLSDKPEVLKKIVDEFTKLVNVPEDDAVAASYEAKEKILNMVAANLKELSEDDIEKNMSIVWRQVPYIWYIIWYTPYIWVVWGPEIVIEREGFNFGQAEAQSGRRFKW
jgi:hypothetical protein